MNLTLRCYARVCGDQWHAICTDLDVAADGATLEEAKASLAACIELYLEGIGDMPADERHRLLTRRAPWHVRTKMALLSFLQRPQGRGATSLGFVLQPHLTVPAPT
ncbi:MAG: hypothetical protein OXH68_10605 [Gammaproteobacteria bacterium]|nr:hypothetical protein [Gammaproteobacteria bacterium]